MDVSKDLHHTVTGSLGPAGISSVAADLLDVAAAVFRCERLLKAPGSTNRYTAFQLSMPLRKPSVWARGATASLAEALEFLGNAKWSFRFPKASGPIPEHTMTPEEKGKDRIALFSGGLDSTCGLAVQTMASDTTLLNSYYTRQKRKQVEIATALGFNDHVQWTLAPQSGPGRSFFYRSFYFLSLAAVVAQSWKIRRLMQFETGILAYAIPPSPWYAMTKHAHPKFLSITSRLFEQLFGGGPWMIENPFVNLTKREEVAAASKGIGSGKAAGLFMKTETCWSHWACHVHGLEKTPGVPCGVCIPCIIRRTALPSDRFRIDLTKRKHQNHEKMGQTFRSYLAFLETVLSCGSADRFYTLLPVHVRQLVPGSVKLETVHGLFVRFGKEFMQTFFP